jgi:hypothetical protein
MSRFRVCAQERASRNDEDTDKPGHDESFFVNAMFTTFMRVRFTNVFDVILQKSARACVWRACIAD